jgi:energy-coupling factor transporter transmembrane protein EcfT
MPDIFLMFLGAIIPLAILACLSLIVGIIVKRFKKRNYALLLYISGVILLCVLLPSFYFGTSKLTESSIGAIQGQSVITISIGSEEVLMQSSWGLSFGFYLVLTATIIAVSVLIFDIRTKLMKKKKL